MPLAANLAPGSPILAVRGGIPFDGGFAFFHRFQDRSIDEADIASRTAILADFIEAASRQYGLSRAPIAIGFSNGAIMAAALLLTRPGLLASAILFRPLSPFRHDLHELVPSPPLGARITDVAVRGGIPFDGGFAFFHRLNDRSIDEADIASRATVLADFIEAARYRLSRAPIAIGFSNGAIMARSCS